MTDQPKLREIVPVPYVSDGLLRALPAPPPGRSGWPWTEESKPPLGPSAQRAGWPKISVVTPSFNQGHYIEETLRSVLLQNYPNLEYIVMDGGSTDATRAVLERYSPWISHWVSARDRGQSDAIARGFELASGDIIAWLCSDDLYLPGALAWVAATHAELPGIGLICGETNLDQGTGWVEWSEFRYKSATPTHLRLVACGQTIRQPSAFWTRDAYRATAGVDRELQFCMDYDLFIKLSKVTRARYIEREVAWMRIHDQAKSARLHHVQRAESTAIVDRELLDSPAPRWQLCAISYAHAMRYVLRTPLYGRGEKLARAVRLALGYVYHFLRGDASRWHPVRGYPRRTGTAHE